MSEPFFRFIRENLKSVSNQLYGEVTHEKHYPDATYEELENKSQVDISLVDALRRRKSTRNFTLNELRKEDLSAVLKYAISKDVASEGSFQYTFPSGGGFYPIETYILISRVEGMEPGLYHYSSVGHALGFIKDCQLSLRQLNELVGGAFTETPQILLMMTMVKSRCIHKYGARIYPLTLIEAGHRAQNLQLCAAAVGLGSCVLGGGTYDPVNELLEVDGMNEHYIYSVAIGEPQGSSS